eukprot:gene9438-19603_t
MASIQMDSTTPSSFIGIANTVDQKHPANMTKITSTVFPTCPTLDAWYEHSLLYPHEPIRATLDEVIGIVNSQDFGKHSWQIEAFFVWYIGDKKNMGYYNFIHHHHSIEEELYFPWIKTKVGADFPSKLQEDHVALVNLLEEIKQLKSVYVNKQPSQDLSILKDKLQLLKRITWGHLEEEEQTIPTMLKNNFTCEDEDKMVSKIISSLPIKVAGPLTAWVYYAMTQWATPEIQQSFLMKLPWIVRKLLISSWLPSYLKNNAKVLQDMKSTIDPSIENPSGTCCSIM